MKRLTMTVLALFTAATLNAQVEDDWAKKMKEEQNNALKEFEQFTQQAIQEYENFRKQANEEYARFMEEAWKLFEAQPEEEPPVKPKPHVPMVVGPTPSPEPVPAPEPKPTPKPVPVPEPVPSPNTVPVTNPVSEPDRIQAPDPVPVPNPVPAPDPDVIMMTEPVRIPDPIVSPLLSKPDLNEKPERPQPMEPIVPSAIPMTAAQNVFLYGSPFAFHLESETTLELKDASEKSVAKMWKQLSDPSYDHVIAECLQQREKKNLCDWAYIQLTQQVAEKHLGKGTNEAVVMQMYLLTQSGYQMRIGRDNANKLMLLIGSKEKIFRYRYFVLNGVKFYIMDRKFNGKGLHIFDHAFPKEKSLSLLMTQPDLKVEKTEKRTITSKRYPEVSITVQTNRNLIDFYNDYPINFNWNYYSLASISPVLKESLYPALRKAIEGKSDLEAANILLNFVQTGFKYQTDDVQFGYERPLYPDESFFYPYCDCEDRSILFSCLVRELLGLDVVLLDYPEHIATAICFKQPVNGDYLVMDGKNYIISDPTYIGARVGECAPKYKTIRPNLIRF